MRYNVDLLGLHRAIKRLTYQSPCCFTQVTAHHSTAKFEEARCVLNCNLGQVGWSNDTTALAADVTHCNKLCVKSQYEQSLSFFKFCLGQNALHLSALRTLPCYVSAQALGSSCVLARRLEGAVDLHVAPVTWMLWMAPPLQQILLAIMSRPCIAVLVDITGAYLQCGPMSSQR